MKFFSFLFLFISGLSLAFGQQPELKNCFNPLVPDFVADPSVVMFNDTFYLYGTTDIDHGLKEMGPPVIWKSTDFINWSFSGTILPEIEWNKPYDFIDAKGVKRTGFFRYWAPGKPIYRNNSYYLFVTIVKPDEKLGTYVLKSDNPNGPFSFTNGTGVYFNDSTKIAEESKPLIDDIDGEPFIDTDGKAYIYWRRRFASKLSDDLLKLEGEKISIPTKFTGYSEGPLLFKRNDIYYYLYTLSGGSNYCYGYMMSRQSPLGPFEAPEGNQVFVHSSKENNIWGPGHGNVFQLPGTDKFIFLYLEYGEGSTTRQVFANRMEFETNGAIKDLIPDWKGVGALYPSYKPQSKKLQIAKISASSYAEPKKVDAKVIPNPNVLTNYRIDNKSGESLERTFTYNPENAFDGSNGTRWQAKADDTNPWIMLDLGKIVKLSKVEMAFTLPTFGHSWLLEKSTDGIHWDVCSRQDSVKICSPHVAHTIGKTRFLRLKITKGSAGIWEFKVY